MRHRLPSGLVVHCEKCDLVVPSDAPRPEGGNCEFVAQHKLSWFNPLETIAGQHAMATAAWSLIYHDVLSASAHAESTEYLRHFKRERKSHFEKSALRQTMTTEQVEAGLAHPRDRALYE